MKDGVLIKDFCLKITWHMSLEHDGWYVVETLVNSPPHSFGFGPMAYQKIDELIAERRKWYVTSVEEIKARAIEDLRSLRDLNPYAERDGRGPTHAAVIAARRAGWRAFHDGKSMRDNPGDEKSCAMFYDWRDGFERAVRGECEPTDITHT